MGSKSKMNFMKSYKTIKRKRIKSLKKTKAENAMNIVIKFI